MKGGVAPIISKRQGGVKMKNTTTATATATCYKCGAPKADRDCDECGIISCDGCAHSGALVCTQTPCRYVPDVLAGAAAIVREAARTAVPRG
jgi:hypothetical protein